MRITRKPVRECHGCPLNLGDRCWGYEFPQRQWRGRRRCSAYADPAVHERFRDWLRQPDVKTTRELRQDAARRKRPQIYHLEGQDA